MRGNWGEGQTLAAVRHDAVPARAANAALSGMRPISARQRRVLLVEDEDMVRKVLTRMLSARGFEVHSAASGTEAMALFDARGGDDFDLLVTDLMMPDGSGSVVARKLSQKRPDLKVLFVSGYSSADIEGWEPERYRFLTKPFGSAELAKMIGELFQSKREASPLEP
jgi:two-component system cell cycle sensor histidine kinase/response regulator CckA